MHGQIDAVPHGLQVRTVSQEHLDAGNGKRLHERAGPRSWYYLRVQNMKMTGNPYPIGSLNANRRASVPAKTLLIVKKALKKPC
jgi:hypothetical protein